MKKVLIALSFMGFAACTKQQTTKCYTCTITIIREHGVGAATIKTTDVNYVQMCEMTPKAIALFEQKNTFSSQTQTETITCK